MKSATTKMKTFKTLSVNVIFLFLFCEQNNSETLKFIIILKYLCLYVQKLNINKSNNFIVVKFCFMERILILIVNFDYTKKLKQYTNEASNIY